MKYNIKAIAIAVFGIFIGVWVGKIVVNGETDSLAYLFITIIGMIGLIAPGFVASLSVMTVHSGLTLPQLQGKLNIHYVAMAGLIGIFIVNSIFKKQKNTFLSSAHYWLIAFAFVIIITIIYRGLGFKILGANQWGGMVYVELFLNIICVFILPRVGIHAKHWRQLLTISAIATIFPAIAIVLSSNGIQTILSDFIQGDHETTLQDYNSFTRYIVLFPLGIAIYQCLFLYISFKKALSKNLLISVLFFIITLVLISLSGFRIALIELILFTCVLAYLSKQISFLNIIIITVFLALIYPLVIIFAPSLPLTGQRMVSIIPGVIVQQEASQDADITTEWRIDVWERGVKSLPDYYLIGKGFAFKEADIISANNISNGTYDATDWALVTSSYHQGILSLLIVFGIPGLITGMMMYTLFLKRHLLLLHEKWNSEPLKLCHLVTTSMLTTGWIIYITIYGDVQTTLISALYLISILESLWVANVSLNEKIR